MPKEYVYNLFSNQEGFEEQDKIVQLLNLRKRGSYNTKPKIYEIDPYTKISNIYSRLANYLPYPLGKNEEMVITKNGLRGWYNIFDAEGELPQRLFQAEIIGTENFYITDRIQVHSKLLEYLNNRVQLEDAVKLIQQEVRELQKKYEVKEFTLWLRKQRNN